jgi:superfamily I DNA/RNA helicase
LKDTSLGCQYLYLTTTYRCGKNIVKEVQSFVPDFAADANNPEGKVSRMVIPKNGVPMHLQIAEPGDMILCRTNAPLVSQCFQLIRLKKTATILGRKIGEDLIRLVERFKASSIDVLSQKVEAWYELEVSKENRKKFPSETRLIALSDKLDCLNEFIQESDSVQEVISKINAIFPERENSKGILLSSAHKSKGLESRRVFLLLLKEAQMPHPMAKTATSIEQEYNLLYVAKTRAIEELVYVVNS